MLPYIDKHAALLNCLLDVYAAQNDWQKCRALITEIDRINETYREQGVFREVSPKYGKKQAHDTREFIFITSLFCVLYWKQQSPEHIIRRLSL